ncbi:hypothetical protein FRB95_012317, partial [Tulasnella sp. JGI-2019a]
TAVTTSSTTTGKVTSSTTSSKVTTSTTTTSVAPSTSTAAHYGQCGGIGWTGATVCASPFVCTYSNAYFSQCL